MVDRTKKPVDCWGRPTCTDTCKLAASWAGRPRGRPTESRFALCLFRSTRRSTGSANGSKYDRWAVDRAVDRQGYFGKICCQRLVSRFAYKYPICKSFSPRFFVRIFSYSLVFLQQSKEVFGFILNNLFGVFTRVWKIKEKGFWESSLFELHYLDFYIFPRIFFELLISIPLVFSTLVLNLLSYSIRSLCGRRDCFVVVV